LLVYINQKYLIKNQYIIFIYCILNNLKFNVYLFDKTTGSPALRPVNSSTYSRGGVVSISNSTSSSLFDEQALRQLTVIAHDIENITIMVCFLRILISILLF
jgi:hypothetical protein